MAKNNDLIMWVIGGILALIGYGWMTSQKAGASAEVDDNPNFADANQAKKGGCGCGL